jgi:hypothetical protein
MEKSVGEYILDLNKQLGKGTFGEVFEGRHKDT